MEADIRVLMEMFPSVREDAIRRLRIGQRLSTNAVIDVLVSENEKSKEPTSVSTILSDAAHLLIDEDDEYFMTTNRACMWNKAQIFYKRAMHDPSLLRKGLVISFSGEEGIDAGALRLEFFEKILLEVNEEYFEGDMQRRVPKCHYGCEMQLQLAGTIVAHSLLLGGPGLPCIHPGLLHVVVKDSLEGLEAHELPRKSDIPLNAATANLIELIDKVSCIEILCVCVFIYRHV